jgi:hypothetical protein
MIMNDINDDDCWKECSIVVDCDDGTVINGDKCK